MSLSSLRFVCVFCVSVWSPQSQTLCSVCQEGPLVESSVQSGSVWFPCSGWTRFLDEESCLRNSCTLYLMVQFGPRVVLFEEGFVDTLLVVLLDRPCVRVGYHRFSTEISKGDCCERLDH